MTKRVFEVFQPPTALVEWPLKAGAPVPHLPDSADVVDAELTIRETFDGPTETFPRNFWRFSIQQYTDAQLVPNLSMLFMAYGFNPNYIYQITYPTSGAPVVGMGLGAIRNITTFLRYESAQRGNPIAGTIDHAYAYGQSQSARLLREFL
jgi:hypothetical protein